MRGTGGVGGQQKAGRERQHVREQRSVGPAEGERVGRAIGEPGDGHPGGSKARRSAAAARARSMKRGSGPNPPLTASQVSARLSGASRRHPVASAAACRRPAARRPLPPAPWRIRINGLGAAAPAGRYRHGLALSVETDRLQAGELRVSSETAPAPWRAAGGLPPAQAHGAARTDPPGSPAPAADRAGSGHARS